LYHIFPGMFNSIPYHITKYKKLENAMKVQRCDANSPKNEQNYKMILRHICKYRTDLNIAHSLLSTIKTHE